MCPIRDVSRPVQVGIRRAGAAVRVFERGDAPPRGGDVATVARECPGELSTASQSDQPSEGCTADSVSDNALLLRPTR